MMSFRDFIDEDKTTDSKGTLLNYITSSFYKLATQEDTNSKAMSLLLAAAIMSLHDDPRAMGMSKRLAQLAVGKQKEKKNVS